VHLFLSLLLLCTRLEDLVAQDDIVSILTNLIDSDNLPHLLLYGPPGTGKTSTIVAAAKRMYGSEASYRSMTLELNASDARGIDVVRNEIKEFAGTKQLFTTGVKLIILDEADAMTSDAQVSYCTPPIIISEISLTRYGRIVLVVCSSLRSVGSLKNILAMPGFA